MCEDPDGDLIFYFFNWGDGSDSGWLGPFDSGEECMTSHTWDEEGQYAVRVKTKDINGYQSDWSESMIVSMPKTKVLQLPTLIQYLINLIKNK
jgi:hypothetical protein